VPGANDREVEPMIRMAADACRTNGLFRDSAHHLVGLEHLTGAGRTPELGCNAIDANSFQQLDGRLEKLRKPPNPEGITTTIESHQSYVIAPPRE
jgi:hypothetical protein